MTTRQLFHLFTDGKLNGSISNTVLAYVIGAAKQPDPGSNFDIATKDVRHLGADAFLEALKDRQYNAIVATVDGIFAGIHGYQKHDYSWHTFAFSVLPRYEGMGIATSMASLFLLTAADHGISNVYIWGGDERKKLTEENRRKMESLYARIAENRLGLPFRCASGSAVGEILIRPEAASSIA